MGTKTLEDIIKDIEDMITTLSKPSITSLMSKERAIGARMAYQNCLERLKSIPKEELIIKRRLYHWECPTCGEHVSYKKPERCFCGAELVEF